MIIGFLWANEEQLGLDPTIITCGDKRCIEIQQEHGTERLVIDKLIKRVRCLAGRATTCWKVHPENDPATTLVVKDSWQFRERDQEGLLLREATRRGVKNVARYFHHETVRVGNRQDDISTNVRKGLDITTATNYTEDKSVPLLNTRNHSLQNFAGKRSSSTAGPPRRKRSCSSSSIDAATANQIHRRVVICDYGRAIYQASPTVSLLAAMVGCLEGYESLFQQTGMLQCDISPNNLMINKDEDNSSWYTFLINLDLAIQEQREQPFGAKGKTGTRAFMAIGVLLDDEPHSFMHDAKSFFWVLF